MRTIRIGLLLAVAGLLMVPSVLGGHEDEPTDDAEAIVEDVLDSLDIDSTLPLEGPDGAQVDSDRGAGSGSGGFFGGLLSAVYVVGDAAANAGEALAGLSTSLADRVLLAVALGFETAATAGTTVAAEPAATAGVVTGLAAVAGGLGLWMLALRFGSLGAVPLFSRIAKSALLDNKVRSEIYELIKQEPGINVSDISRRLTIAWGTTTHHLQKLRAERLVSVRKTNNRKCYFQNGGAYSPHEMSVISATKNDTARRIAELLVGQGPHCHKDIAATLGLSPGLTSFHMRKLEGAGVVSRHREGRRIVFSPTVDAVRPVARVSAA